MVREHRFGFLLLALCAAVAALRAILLGEYLAENPFAAFPYSDGELYWNRAGEMAAGRWQDDSPFLIGPFYPYLLGLLRWLGGGLPTLYVAQLALHLASGALIGDAARRRFGAGAGIGAAALFFAIGSPALFATRVLSVTLQILLVALVWWDWARLAADTDRPLGAVLRVGAWMGLLTLAFPAALLLAPAYALWLLRDAADRRTGLRRALAGVGAVALLVSPATIHNAARSGEFIPVTAHGGVTLAQGNSPESIGIYTPLDGLSTDVHRQHGDAARLFASEHGRSGAWREIDAHFRQGVFDWWSAHPLDAAALFARKLGWFATARHYDNVAVFELEREQGLLRSSILAPLEVPWILGAALLGGALLLGRREPFAPELAIAAVPLVVCVVFHYSARYRLVGLPVLCGLAALAASRWRELPWPRPAVAALALLPVPLLLADARFGFDELAFMRAPYTRTLADHHVRSGRALETHGDAEAAAAHFRRAVDTDRTHRRAHEYLYNAQVARADYSGAIDTLEWLVGVDPTDVETRLALGWLLATCPDATLRRGATSARHAQEALRLTAGKSPEASMVLALAEAERGRFAEALKAARRGIEAARALEETTLLRNFEILRAHLEQRRALRSEPRLLRLAAR